MNQRDTSVDCIKGYACLLIVLAHVMRGLVNSGISVPEFEFPLAGLLRSFDVSLFFFLSGYVYKITGRWEKKGSRSRYLLHKLISIGIPYFLISTMYIIINSFIPGVNTSYALSDILLLWKTPVAQYWYLYSLFLLFFMYVLLSRFFSDVAITIILVALSYLQIIFSFNIPILSYGIVRAICFGFGLCTPDIKIFMKKKYLLLLLLIIQLGSFLLFYQHQWTDIQFCHDYLAIIGIMTNIAFISMVTQCALIKRCLLFFSKYCFQIYCMHTIFTSATRILLTKLSVTNFYIHTVVGFAVGVLIPLVIAWICAKTVIFDFFFFPIRTVKKIRGSTLLKEGS